MSSHHTALLIKCEITQESDGDFSSIERELKHSRAFKLMVEKALRTALGQLICMKPFKIPSLVSLMELHLKRCAAEET